MRALAKSAWSRARLVTGVALTIALAGSGSLVMAFQQGGFVKVPDDQLARQETLPAAPLLMTAYAFVWLAIFVFVFMTWRRIARVERELAQLNRSARDRAAAPGARG